MASRPEPDARLRLVSSPDPSSSKATLCRLEQRRIKMYYLRPWLELESELDRYMHAMYMFWYNNVFIIILAQFAIRIIKLMSMNPNIIMEIIIIID